MDKNTAKKIIMKTGDDYNLIAAQFSSTRKFTWGDVGLAMASLQIKPNSKVLDLGCGNGRSYAMFRDLEVDYYGLDLSRELINLAQKEVPAGNFTVGNMLETPYKNDEFDVVISIATLHHLPSKKSRQLALEEIYRVTKPGGQVLVTTWYFWNKPQYIKEILKTFVQILRGKSDLDPGDFYMPWRDGSGKEITKRYFHAWRKRELKQYLEQVGFRDINFLPYLQENAKLGRNLLAIAKK